MRDLLWTASEISAITNGKVIGADFPVTGISIDTRTIQKGDLFIALEGPRFNGNDFTAQAIKAGAAGALAERGDADHHIIVKDTFLALQDLGAGARARSSATIIAVTGSVGKTSAKAMLQTAFATLGDTHAAEASLNNHWGVPLSLARMPPKAKYAVFEIGMNHANEISPLSKQVAPHIALITTVAPAHIEHLGTIENIALAKAEIFHGMDANGIAILPRDSEQFSILLAEARTQGLQNILSFGEHKDADIRLMDIELHAGYSIVSASVRGNDITFRLGVPGKHQAMNALAVLGALVAVGADLEKPLQAFAQMSPVSGRGNRLQVELKAGQSPLTIIDETHNASPIAVEAALTLLSRLPSQGKKIVALGDMLELGPDSPQLHAGLSASLKSGGFDSILLCGPMMKHLADTLPADKTQYYTDSTQMALEIGAQVQPGDVLMIKGSRGSKMKLVVDAVMALGHIGKNLQSQAG